MNDDKTIEIRKSIEDRLRRDFEDSLGREPAG